MMTKMIAPIALALMLGALPASAGQRNHRAEERHETKIETLAQKLDRATSELYSEARERGRYRGWRELRAVRSLRRLEYRAAVYENRVERHGAESRPAARAWRDLDHAYRVAAAQRDVVCRRRGLQDEFGRVDRLMEKLDRRIARLDSRDEPRRHASRRHDDDRLYVAFRIGR